MTVTKETGLAGLQARMESEFGSRLMAQLPRLGWDATRLAAHQTERLRILLAAAIKRSPFHARRLGRIDPARFELADLARLPVMTKAQMMASFDEVVTDRRLTLGRVDDHLRAAGPELALLLGDYVCLATGGSSGQRGMVVQTIAEYADHAAAILRYPIAGMLAAGQSPDGAVLALNAAGAPVHSTRFLAAALGGGPVRMVPVPVSLPLAEAVGQLNALQPAVLVGYPARLAQLAAEQRAGRLHIAPRSVGTTSEMLTDANRAAITAAFGVPVVNSFACTEGLTGASEPGGTVISFATDLCLAELTDAASRPAPAGTPSAEVLITNLHNLTQPLIRYQLADSFTAVPGTRPGGYLRATVEGRDDGMLRFGDVGIHPHAIRTVLASAAAVTEYQVRQTPRGIDVAVVARDGLDHARLTAGLASSLRHGGLPGPQVTVRVVAAIARHRDTGKARCFIPIGDDDDAIGDGDSGYPFGSGEDELARLELQGRALAPATRMIFQTAGIRPGMRVLDLGCGAGDVAFVAAGLVGPDGHVVGVDRSPQALTRARLRAGQLGLAQVRFVEGDIHDPAPHGPFDAIVGRLVFNYAPDPAAVLRSQATVLRPGGLVVPIEIDLATGRALPASPLVSQAVSWLAEAFARTGRIPALGTRLWAIHRQAGLRPLGMIGIQPHFGPDDPAAIALLAGIIRTAAPLIERTGVATAEEIGADTFAQRLKDETQTNSLVAAHPILLSAWATNS